MSNVTLSIGGREYKVACAEGEEQHVTRLGQIIDDKIEKMGGSAQGESQSLLFAALLLADETVELGKRAASAAPADVAPPSFAPDLSRIADAMENCANRLEGLADAP